MLVALDAGHGKFSAGKCSPDQTFIEYEFNRAIAIRVKKHLERCGVPVLLTTSGDSDISLSKRCRIANKAKADIFVSLHANATGDKWSSERGFEIYIEKFGDAEEKLARSIHDEAIPFLGLKDRGIKYAHFFVLTKTKMPSCLIKHGFYTNIDEVILLKGTVFRDKIAMADAKGIVKYLGITWVGEAEVT